MDWIWAESGNFTNARSVRASRIDFYMSLAHVTWPGPIQC
jgi:hypothetical protein